MTGQPVAFFTANGTKRQRQGPPCPDDIRTSAQRFRAEFWTGCLQALKRHIDSTQTSSGAPGGGPDAEDDA